MLFGYCKQQQQSAGTGDIVGWNVTMPGPILGAVPDTAMNAAFPLAVYARLCARLDESLEFPIDTAS
jgi:hypothetical protein